MQLKNIAIGTKIWLSLCLVMASLTCTGAAAIYHLNSVSLAMGAQTKYVDDRKVEVERWRWLSKLWLDSVKTASTSEDLNIIMSSRSNSSTTWRKSWRCRTNSWKKPFGKKSKPSF